MRCSSKDAPFVSLAGTVACPIDVPLATAFFSRLGASVAHRGSEHLDKADCCDLVV